MFLEFEFITQVNFTESTKKCIKNGQSVSENGHFYMRLISQTACIQYFKNMARYLIYQ
jgi:hypothetical protein